MSWRDRLFGSRTTPVRGTTTEPEPKTNWEDIAAQTRRTGQEVKDLFRVLQRRPRSPVRVCRYGHVVPEGSTTCTEGHYVG